MNRKQFVASIAALALAPMAAVMGKGKPTGWVKSLESKDVLFLRADGVWASMNCLYIYDSKVAGEKGEFARINWKNPDLTGFNDEQIAEIKRKQAEIKDVWAA